MNKKLQVEFMTHPALWEDYQWSWSHAFWEMLSHDFRYTVNLFVMLMCAVPSAPSGFRPCASLLPSVEDKCNVISVDARSLSFKYSYLSCHYSPFPLRTPMSYFKSRKEDKETRVSLLFTLLRWINNPWIPCSTLFYLNNVQTPLWSNPPKERQWKHCEKGAKTKLFRNDSFI